jgi:serine/threonine protein kinase
VIQEIGEGGMGSVYLARQKMLKRYCALKVIHPYLASKPGPAERFLREARAAAGMSHPNLVNVFDCDQFESQFFIAMEYIEGLNLAEILREHGALPLPLALYWLSEAATALEYAQSRGVIHRDIKPDNLIIDAEGKLRLMDLGLVKTLFDDEPQMTTTGYMMGTPYYMSPEQINDAKTVDARADVYSLGVTFFHMVVGRAPFVRSSVAAICVAHMQDPMPSVGLADPDVANSLDALIGQMTAKNRELRYQSMTEVLTDLRLWLQRFPLDPASTDFCSRLDVSDRAIGKKLETAGVDRTLIDSDIKTTTNTLVMADQSAPAWWRRPVAAVAFGLLVLIMVAAGIFVARDRPPPEAMVTPPVPVPSKTGSLLVSVNPKGAFVLFQGHTKEVVDGAISFEDVPPGNYPVEVRRPGYRTATLQISVAADTVAKPQVTLERIPGTAQIVSEPAGANVLLEGSVAGETPYTMRGGDGDEVRCELRYRGYEAATLTLVLHETGSVERVQLARARPAQKLAARQESTPSDAPAAEPGAASNERRPFEPAQLRQKFGALLIQSRTATAHWLPAGRQVAQKELEDFFSSVGMPAEHVAMVTRDLLSVLDAGVKLSNADFEQQRPALVRQMMESFHKRIPGPGDADQPPDGPPDQ